MKAYQFKITVRGLRPPIWRRIVIPACMSFQDFSEIIQSLFGFDGFHLAEFSFPSLDVSMQERYDPDSWHYCLVMGRHALEEYEAVKKYKYLYDFGDCWEFDIVLEKILEDYENNYPAVLKSKGNKLVEDCGGIWGYSRLLEAWETKGEDTEELREWAGEPEQYEFDKDAANEEMRTWTCDENGTFIVKEGTDEEPERDEEDEDYPDFMKSFFLDALEAELKKDDSGLGVVLLDMMRNPEELEKLATAERLPKNRGEQEFLIAYLTACTTALTAEKAAKITGMDTDELLDAMELDEGMRFMVSLVRTDEEDLPF